jgi:hypothetical protein
VATEIAIKLGSVFGRDSETYPAHFLSLMSPFPQYLIPVYICLLLVGTASIDAAPTGFVEGHLKIISPKEVEIADETPSKITAENYAAYPLIILSRDAKKEIARVTADKNGYYRLALPPGDYVLDVPGRRPKGHIRAAAQSFTILSNQTVHVDMSIDTGVR